MKNLGRAPSTFYKMSVYEAMLKNVKALELGGPVPSLSGADNRSIQIGLENMRA